MGKYLNATQLGVSKATRKALLWTMRHLRSGGIGDTKEHQFHMADGGHAACEFDDDYTTCGTVGCIGFYVGFHKAGGRLSKLATVAQVDAGFAEVTQHNSIRVKRQAGDSRLNALYFPNGDNYEAVTPKAAASGIEMFLKSGRLSADWARRWTDKE